NRDPACEGAAGQRIVCHGGHSSCRARVQTSRRRAAVNSEAVQERNPRRDRVVELDRDDQPDAQPGVDDAKQRRQQIKRLGDVDAAADGSDDVAWLAWLKSRARAAYSAAARISAPEPGCSASTR